MKSGDDGPYWNPIAVASAVTKDEWLDGIPPVFQNIDETTSPDVRDRCLAISMSVFSSWAMNQEKEADKNTGPETSSYSADTACDSMFAVECGGSLMPLSSKTLRVV